MCAQIKIKHIAIITGIALIAAAVVSAVLAVFLPPASAPVALTAQVMPEWKQLIAPEHDVLLYRAFILTACCVQLSLCFLWGRKMKMPNLFWASVLSVAAGSIVTAIVYYVTFHIPYPSNNLLSQIFPFFTDMIRPEREMPLYALFILSTVFFQCVWLKIVPGTNSLKNKTLAKLVPVTIFAELCHFRMLLSGIQK